MSVWVFGCHTHTHKDDQSYICTSGELCSIKLHPFHTTWLKACVLKSNTVNNSTSDSIQNYTKRLKILSRFFLLFPWYFGIKQTSWFDVKCTLRKFCIQRAFNSIRNILKPSSVRDCYELATWTGEFNMTIWQFSQTVYPIYFLFCLTNKT